MFLFIIHIQSLHKVNAEKKIPATKEGKEYNKKMAYS